MKIFVIGIIIVASLTFIASIIWYAINRPRYYELLNRFQRKYTFPAPYSFSSMVGFFGAPLMTYFFLRLKNRKNILFVEKTSDVYTFPDNDTIKLMSWLPVFKGLLIICMVCYSFLMIFAVFLEAKDRFFP